MRHQERNSISPALKHLPCVPCFRSLDNSGHPVFPTPFPPQPWVQDAAAIHSLGILRSAYLAPLASALPRFCVRIPAMTQPPLANTLATPLDRSIAVRTCPALP